MDENLNGEHEIDAILFDGKPHCPLCAASLTVAPGDAVRCECGYEVRYIAPVEPEPDYPGTQECAACGAPANTVVADGAGVLHFCPEHTENCTECDTPVDPRSPSGFCSDRCQARWYADSCEREARAERGLPY